MKKLVVYTVIGLMSMTASSQWCGPLVGCWATNPSSIAQSQLIAAAVGILNTTTLPRSVRELKKFKDEYRKRLAYTGPSAVGYKDVGHKINAVSTRATAIGVKNEGTPFYFRYKLNSNREKILTITKAINNLRVQLIALKPTAHWGELVNLEQNLEMSLEDLERRLDAIESDIDNSKLLSSFIASVK